MALKDLTTNQAADILVRLSAPMSNIATDEKIMETVGKSMDTTGMTKVGRNIEALKRVFTSIPLLLGTHKSDVFEIVAIVKGKTAQDVAEQPITVTLSEIKEITKDKDLLDFFSEFGPGAKGA